VRLALAAGTLHLGEAGPPLVAGSIYLIAYLTRARTLARQGRPVPAARWSAFVAGVVLVTVVQSPPLDELADSVLVAHMAQHILIGDVASLLIVVGLTGPLMQPVLRLRPSKWLRRALNPVVALGLWSLDLYVWHLPALYELAIRVDLVHALEHACLLWFGVLLWMALLGPLPKPAWFTNWARLGYIAAVRLVGALLANVLIWAGTVFYPYYDGRDVQYGLSPLSDQNIAGAIMLVEQVILTTALLAWLFLRFASQDEERQQLVDLAAERGVALTGERAARAAASGGTARLRRRVLDTPPDG
jgi:cytochrome c oxidase assembly factor CtaG